MKSPTSGADRLEAALQKYGIPDTDAAWYLHVRQNRRSVSAPRVVRRAESSGRPRAGHSSSSSSSSRGDPDSESAEGDGEPPPPDLTPPPRICECGCGRSIAHKRADAQFFDNACRMRATRARERVEVAAPVQAKSCQCDHGDVVDYDPDHDLVCVLCGRARGAVSTRINGYDATADLMRSNGVFVRRPRRTREWRTRPSRSEAARLRKTRKFTRAVA